MRIHSNFKDYYDTAAGFGIDTTLQYNRKEEKHYYGDIKAKLPIDATRLIRSFRRTDAHPDYNGVLVGFCGKVYPCLRFPKRIEKWPWIDSSESLYTKAALVPYEHCVNRYELPGLRRWLSEGREHEELFIEVNAPIFLIERETEGACDWILTVNVPLKPLEFFKIVDAFTAFQEISMFLGNQLCRREKIEDIPDKFKIGQHGFDKHSFRNLPERKK